MLRVLNTLKEAGIQIVASTISDTVEYGIFRIICAAPSEAFKLLKGEGMSVTMTDVFAVVQDNIPGKAAEVFEAFSRQDINISYMYSFMLGGKGILIFRTSDTEKARETIMLNNIKFVSQEGLNELM